MRHRRSGFTGARHSSPTSALPRLRVVACTGALPAPCTHPPTHPAQALGSLEWRHSGPARGREVFEEALQALKRPYGPHCAPLLCAWAEQEMQMHQFRRARWVATAGRALLLAASVRCTGYGGHSAAAHVRTRLRTPRPPHAHIMPYSEWLEVGRWEIDWLPPCMHACVYQSEPLVNGQPSLRPPAGLHLIRARSVVVLVVPPLPW